MTWKKKQLVESHLYLITDENIETARSALQAGAEIVQLRLKNTDADFFLEKAFKLKEITEPLKKVLIINDRPDIAKKVDADGLHLGQEDISIKEAKKLLPGKIIGKSTHSLKQAKAAVNEGADYIGIGPAFKTKTKPEYKTLSIETIQKIIESIDIPYFVIGGITTDNVKILIKHNINKVAVFSAIIKSEDPYGQTKNFLTNLR
jgi:thiamine-phosphate pyrophosphorylase